MLQDCWSQVQDGLGQMVLIRGEPGIGKSRLVQVLKEYAVPTPHTFLDCRGSPHYQHTPFYPLTQLLQRLLRWRRHDPPDQQLTALEVPWSHFSSPSSRSYPFLLPSWPCHSLLAAMHHLISLPSSKNSRPSMPCSPYC